MRTIETIDQELRLLAAVRVTLRRFGAIGSTSAVDQLLDERLQLSGSNFTNSLTNSRCPQ